MQCISRRRTFSNSFHGGALWHVKTFERSSRAVRDVFQLLIKILRRRGEAARNRRRAGRGGPAAQRGAGRPRRKRYGGFPQTAGFLAWTPLGQPVVLFRHCTGKLLSLWWHQISFFPSFSIVFDEAADTENYRQRR